MIFDLCHLSFFYPNNTFQTYPFHRLTQRDLKYHSLNNNLKLNYPVNFVSILWICRYQIINLKIDPH